MLLKSNRDNFLIGSCQWHKLGLEPVGFVVLVFTFVLVVIKLMLQMLTSTKGILFKKKDEKQGEKNKVLRVL